MPTLRRRRRAGPRPRLPGAATCRSVTSANSGKASQSGTCHRSSTSLSHACPSRSNALDWSAKRTARTSRNAATSDTRTRSQRSAAASSKTAHHISGGASGRGRQRWSGC
eukprot:7815493-Alexandrium_andersonii.AAC.1